MFESSISPLFELMVFIIICRMDVWLRLSLVHRSRGEEILVMLHVSIFWKMDWFELRVKNLQLLDDLLIALPFEFDGVFLFPIITLTSVVDSYLASVSQWVIACLPNLFVFDVDLMFRCLSSVRYCVIVPDSPLTKPSTNV